MSSMQDKHAVGQIAKSIIFRRKSHLERLTGAPVANVVQKPAAA